MPSLPHFLSLCPGETEVALVIASESDELVDFTQVLAESGVPFLLVNADNEKTAYDYAVQYPTGQIEIFDADKMQSIVTHPVYEGSAFALLMTADTLAHMQSAGLDLLSVVGLTYRS